MIDELGQIDLANPDHYVEGRPVRVVRPAPRRSIRSSGIPSQPPNRGFWAVTRYDDLTAVHMDWETYSSEIGAVGLEELDEEQLADPQLDARDRSASSHELPEDLLEAFSARGVGAYEDWIRDVARGVLDQALALGEPFDFVSEISRELPIRFLCSIFTVPQEDAPALIQWGDQMIANQDPDLVRGRGRPRTPRRTGCCRSAPRPRSRCSRTPTGSATAAGGAGRRRDRGARRRAVRGDPRPSATTTTTSAC